MQEFSSFGSFAMHLVSLEAKVKVSERRALERVGKMLETHAKAKFGEYQPAAGPFAAWAELAPSTQDSRRALGFPSDQPLLRMGTLRESVSHEVQHNEVHMGSTEQNMLWQELGTKRIPPRSVLGATLAEHAEAVVETLGGGTVQALIGEGEKVELAKG